MTIISKTDFTVDLDQMIKDMHSVLQYLWWPEHPLGSDQVSNQISLKHRPGYDSWLDGVGSLKDKNGKVFAEEKDFTEWNANVPLYTKQVLDELQQRENVKLGRVRYMRLLPKTGLRVHFDFEYRYHLPIVTNRFSMFGHVYEGQEEIAKCYHIPATGTFYKVDTRMPHFVYNGGTEERVHLVCCVAE